MAQPPKPGSEIVLYQTEDGRTRLEVKLENNSVWLSLNQIAALFQRDKSVISKHIKNAYEEKELIPQATVAKFATVQKEGKREVSREIEFYNLDVIIAVGYRVKSQRGTEFRQWATARLGEYLVKGFVLDDERLKNPPGPGVPDYFDDLLERIRDIRASERRMYLRVREILALAADYKPDETDTQLFFQTVQNKLHFAVTGKTAPELIAGRADAGKPNMGLTTWKGAVVRKGDVTVAKNYLSEDEITQLNRIVTMFLDYAEDQAQRRKQVFIRDWRTKLDEFLKFNERAVLGNAGAVSREEADRHAQNQYAAFEDRRRKELETKAETDFAAGITALEQKVKENHAAKAEGKEEMNQHVNSIAGRLSLRPPQRESLEILERVTEIVPPSKNPDVAVALTAISSEYPKVTDFEREFPSICFALATGVGKTRLMGAFIAYLHLAKGINNFFVLAPNLTIYNKLISDFTPNTPKYVFKGVAEFATDVPEIITGDTYDKRSLFGDIYRVRINIFNISKINSEVRGGNLPRIKRLSEYIGQSYFDYLASLPDLVLLMDESHRYRASAGIRAINELKPMLGLEVTATPFVETPKGALQFKNVVYDYPLARAMADGFVKEPAVVTQKNFDPRQFTPAQLEELKLQDGIRLHEATKVELETYARQNECRLVKPFVLVIARDITHAKELLDLIESEKFFDGRYKGRVIQVDSSQTGAQEEVMIEKLLKVEDANEPTEIVIHVNMLKEGWDVNNLYTIVPLRAANARILIEQSIGRGLRLPYGVRTGVTAVDRLNIVAHDRFQEIVDEANKPDSVVRLTQVILDPLHDLQPTKMVISQPTIIAKLTEAPSPTAPGATADTRTQPLFQTEQERKIAEITVKVIQQHESLPQVNYLQKADVQAAIIKEVAAAYTPPAQTEMTGIIVKPDIAAIVAKATKLVIEQTINIPRIVIVPTGDVTSGFNSFTLDCSSVHLQPVSRELLIQHLRTAKQEFLENINSESKEARPEDYLVRSLIDFDDISYDDHADLLYELASQLVKHLRTYLSEEDTVNVLQYHQKQLAALIHSQMQLPEHRWEKATGYKATVSKGFSALKQNAYTASATDEIRPFRMTLSDPSNIKRYLFGGFAKCLYESQKFDVDTERRFAVILEDDSDVLKWFKPARGQFQIYYSKEAAYEPDFVVETKEQLFLCEPKRADQLQNPEVLAKRMAASEWCKHATEHAQQHGGKMWNYLLIPHDAITGNMTLQGLASRYQV